MYKYKYKVIHSDRGIVYADPNMAAYGITSDSTLFVARFRFHEEVAPINFKDLIPRISVKGTSQLKHDIAQIENLASFLDSEGYQLDSNPSLLARPKFYKGNVKLRVEYPIFAKGPSFNIRASANAEVKLEKILDLDKLNKFILTGER